MKMSPRTVSIGVVSLTMVGFLGLMAFGLLSKSPVTGLSGLFRVQKPAPEIRMSLINGGELVLSEQRGRPMVINFWASWCPPCREEALVLERVWQVFRDKGVVFLGVNIQDTEEDARSFLAEFDITYPNGLDSNGEITVDYGVIGLPVTFFVNTDGIVDRRWVGAISERQLVAWVDEILAGVAPSGPAEGENPEGYFKLDKGR